MCGLFASLGVPLSHRQAKDTLRQMRHRGPDDERYLLSDNFCLCHTRLAIVAPEEAQQPFVSPCGRFALVFNGEIFNHLDLRQRVDVRNWPYRTRSDTETLLSLLVAGRGGVPQAVASLREIRGFYAFCMVDLELGEALAVCDPMGIKPLHYVVRGDGVLLASEPASLVAYLDRAAPNTSVLPEFLVFGGVAGNRTVFSDIYSLQPGDVLTWNLRHGVRTAAAREKLLPDYEDLSRDNVGELADTLAEELQTASELWTLGDVQIGALVSSGIDSLSVARWIEALLCGVFTAGFGDADVRDEPKLVAELFQSKAVTVTIRDSDWADLFLRAVNSLGEPMCDANYLTLYALTEACRAADFKAVITGDGADELFGGYGRHIDVSRRLVSAGSDAPRLLAWGTNEIALPRLERMGISAPIDCAVRLSGAAVVWDLCGGDAVEAVCRYDQLYFLEMYLNRNDRVGMSLGVEYRPVFLDQRIVALSRSIEGSSKIEAGIGKKILRLAAEEVIGIDLAWKAEKIPFSAPSARLWSEGRQFDSLLRTAVENEFRSEIYLDPSGVLRLLEEHQSGASDHANTLWRVLSLEYWLQTVFP